MGIGVVGIDAGDGVDVEVETGVDTSLAPFTCYEPLLTAIQKRPASTEGEDFCISTGQTSNRLDSLSNLTLRRGMR